MTSYDRAEVADVDPAYGLQLHHPRFLEYVGAPRVGTTVNMSTGTLVRTMECEEAVTAALQLQHYAGLNTSNLQVLGQFVTSLNRMSSEVMTCIWQRSVPVRRGASRFAGSPGSPRCALHIGNGFVVTAGCLRHRP